MTSMGSSPAVHSSAHKASLLQSATVNSKQPQSAASEKQAALGSQRDSQGPSEREYKKSQPGNIS